MRLRSHVYSSCLPRHACESAAPFPGKSVSARRVTECTLKSVPYASKTSAEISPLIEGPPRADATIGASPLQRRKRIDPNVLVGLSLSFPAHAGAREERRRDVAAARR